VTFLTQSYISGKKLGCDKIPIMFRKELKFSPACVLRADQCNRKDYTFWKNWHEETDWYGRIYCRYDNSNVECETCRELIAVTSKFSQTLRKYFISSLDIIHRFDCIYNRPELVSHVLQSNYFLIFNVSDNYLKWYHHVCVNVQSRQASKCSEYATFIVGTFQINRILKDHPVLHPLRMTLTVKDEGRTRIICHSSD